MNKVIPISLAAGAVIGLGVAFKDEIRDFSDKHSGLPNVSTLQADAAEKVNDVANAIVGNANLTLLETDFCEVSRDQFKDLLRAEIAERTKPALNAGLEVFDFNPITEAILDNAKQQRSQYCIGLAMGLNR